MTVKWPQLIELNLRKLLICFHILMSTIFVVYIHNAEHEFLALLVTIVSW